MAFPSGPLVLLTVAAYFALVLLIGIWSTRRTRSARDFWIAGQSIGLVVTGLATTSAAFSGFVFLGGPGLMYRIGVGSLFIVIPLGLTGGLLCWVVGAKLRRLAEAREIFTIPDAVRCRYRSRWATTLAALAVLLGTVTYLGAQFLALGRLLEALLDTRDLFGPWSLAIAMGFGVGVVLFYSITGGMVAGVYTDLFQGSLMVVASVAVFLHALSAGGGLTELTRSIYGSPSFGPPFLDPLGNATVFTAFGFYFVFGIGSLGQPHVLHKFYMLDDPAKLKWMPLLLGVTQSLSVLIWLGVGLAVPALVAQGKLAPLETPDDAAPAYLLHFAPPLLAGLACAGILAAIMSTANSFLNIGAAALVRDLPRAFGKEVARELFWGRLATLGISLAAAAGAYLHGDLVALLGTLAFGTFGAALGPALAVGLNWERVTARAAIASIATGMVLNVLLELLARRGKLPFAEGVLPTAVSLAASFTVLMMMSWWTGRPEGDTMDEDVRAVVED